MLTSNFFIEFMGLYFLLCGISFIIICLFSRELSLKPIYLLYKKLEFLASITCNIIIKIQTTLFKFSDSTYATSIQNSLVFAYLCTVKARLSGLRLSGYTFHSYFLILQLCSHDLKKVFMAKETALFES